MLLCAVVAASAIRTNAHTNTSSTCHITFSVNVLVFVHGFYFFQRQHIRTQLDISVYDGSLKRYNVRLYLLWSDILLYAPLPFHSIIIITIYSNRLASMLLFFLFFSEDSRKEYLLTLTPKWNDILKRRNENITTSAYIHNTYSSDRQPVDALERFISHAARENGV